jgi:tetratricopeptide (TPR) repeat protein
MLRLGKKDEMLSYLKELERKGKLAEKHDEVVGEIYMILKNYDQAQYYLKRSIANNPQAAKSYALLASIMDMQGNTEGALMLLEGVREKFEQPDFLIQLGALYHKTGNIAKEFQIFRRMSELYKKDPRPYFYLAKIILDKGQSFDKVIELTKKGLSLEPNPEYEIFGNYLLADVYTNMGMNDRAATYYAKARKIGASQTPPGSSLK